MVCRYCLPVVFCVTIGILGLPSNPCIASWTIEPVDLSGEVGWSLYLDTDSSGTPHAAYFTTNPNGDFIYSRREEAGWQRKAVIDNGSAFAVDQAGDPFFINEPGPNFYPHFQILLDNGLLLGQQLAATRISDGAYLDFDKQNRPHLGWVDTTAQQLKHSFWNGTSWTTRTVASGPEFRFGNSSYVATLDDADQMHFAWPTEADRLQYAKPNGNAWQISSPFPTQNARPFDIDVDASGNLHLAYDHSTGNVFTGGLTYSLYNGSTWAGGRIPDLEAFGAGRSKIVADAAGEPHIFSYDSAFSGPDKLKHIYRENGAWVNETIDMYTSNTSGPDNIEAAIDAQGLHVLYSTGNKQIYYAFQPVGAVLAGDYDDNGIVDAADYVVWRDAMADSIPGTSSSADGNSDGQITQADYDVWRANFGRTADTGPAASLASIASIGLGSAGVPEPSSLLTALVAVLCGAPIAIRPRRHQTCRPDQYPGPRRSISPSGQPAPPG
jgi:hypothetical protein